MKHTGIIRKIDELGRIVLPAEIRRTLDIVEKDEVSINLRGDEIILRKNVVGCSFCSSTKNLTSHKGKAICSKCIDELK